MVDINMWLLGSIQRCFIKSSTAADGGPYKWRPLPRQTRIAECHTSGEVFDNTFRLVLDLITSFPPSLCLKSLADPDNLLFQVITT